jgi:hypothetical protein
VPKVFNLSMTLLESHDLPCHHDASLGGALELSPRFPSDIDRRSSSPGTVALNATREREPRVTGPCSIIRVEVVIGVIGTRGISDKIPCKVGYRFSVVLRPRPLILAGSALLKGLSQLSRFSKDW